MELMEYKDRSTILYALEQAYDRMDWHLSELKEAKEKGDYLARILTEEFSRYKKDMKELHDKLNTLFDEKYCVFLSPNEFDESQYIVDESDESDEEE